MEFVYTHVIGRVQDFPRLSRCDVIDQEIPNFIAIQYLVSWNRDSQRVFLSCDLLEEIRELLLREEERGEREKGNWPIKAELIKRDYPDISHDGIETPVFGQILYPIVDSDSF